MDKDDRYTRITLRIPKELHERLADSADKTSKSMNAEIIARLSESFEIKSTDDRAVERITELDREVASLTIEGFRLMKEANAIADQMERTPDADDKRVLMDKIIKITSKVGHLEVTKQRLVRKITGTKL